MAYIRAGGQIPKPGTGLPPRTSQYADSDIVTMSDSGARATKAAIQGAGERDPGRPTGPATNPWPSVTHSFYPGYVPGAQPTPSAAPAPAPAPSPFGGGEVGGGGATTAMQGLATALGDIGDPMSALSLPAGMREGLGRRAYPPLANALAGLRY